MSTGQRSAPAGRRRKPTASESRSHTRVAVGVGLTAAVAAMTSIATQTSGTFWAGHAWVAWALLGLLVAALVINELPRLLSADYWLVVLTVAGVALAAWMWVSTRAGPPLDGSDPTAFTPDGDYPSDTGIEQDAVVKLGAVAYGKSEVEYSQRYRVVWGGFQLLVDPTGPQEVDANVTISRSTDGRTVSAGTMAIVPGEYQRLDGDLTPTLALVPGACYHVTVTLTDAAHDLGSTPTTWCAPAG